jgi:hypothetical protein
MGILGVGIYADSDTESSVTALNLVNEKIEELKGVTFSGINDQTETGSSIGFSWIDQRSVSVDEPYGANVLKNVTVTVQWTQKNNLRSVSVDTAIANY